MRENLVATSQAINSNISCQDTRIGYPLDFNWLQAFNQRTHMNKTTILLLSTTVLLFSGVEKSRPNSEFVRMPGAYHTEVVPDGNKVKVYLLDIDWKNPSVKDASVKIYLDKKRGKCKASEDHFICDLPKETTLKSGKLLLKTKREGQTGNNVTYELPLKLEKAKDEHSRHH